MAKVVSVSDASDRLGALLDEVRLRNAAFVIERDGRPAAALVPVGFLEQLVASSSAKLGSGVSTSGSGRTSQVASPSDRPTERIAALRSMLAEPRGGERFEDVLERTFANVRKQRRKHLHRGHDV